MFNSAHRISCFKSVSIMLTRPVQIIHTTESHAFSFLCFSYVVFKTERLTWVWSSGVCGPGVSGAARRRRRHGVVGFSFKIFLERSLILLEPRIKHVFNGHMDFKLSGIMFKRRVYLHEFDPLDSSRWLFPGGLLLLLFLLLATALNSALLPSSGCLDQKHFLYLLTFLPLPPHFFFKNPTGAACSAPPVFTPIPLTPDSHCNLI